MQSFCDFCWPVGSPWFRNPSWFAGKFPKKFKQKHRWIFHSLHVPRSILHGYLLILTSLLVWKWEYLRSPAKNLSFFAGYLADWQWFCGDFAARSYPCLIPGHHWDSMNSQNAPKNGQHRVEGFSGFSGFSFGRMLDTEIYWERHLRIL